MKDVIIERRIVRFGAVSVIEVNLEGLVIRSNFIRIQRHRSLFELIGCADDRSVKVQYSVSYVVGIEDIDQSNQIFGAKSQLELRCQLLIERCCSRGGATDCSRRLNASDASAVKRCSSYFR